MKNSKVWKILGASGLAVFMGGTALFGALWTPTTASAASGPDSAAATAGADPYGLDPQTDKVIADLGGLQIKYHNLSASKDMDFSVNPNLYGYPYIDMSDGLQYVIVGMHSSFLSSAPFRQNVVNDIVQGSTTQWDLADDTPASNAILLDYFNLSNVKTSERIDKDLLPGQMLCVCSTRSGSNTYYGSANANSTYPTSIIYTRMDEVYTNFSSTEKKFIAPVTLTTHHGGNNYVKLENQHVFALAGFSQDAENFHFANYLTANEASQGNGFWTRSTSNSTGSNSLTLVVYVTGAGVMATHYATTWGGSGASVGVRPAFVLDLNGV